MSGRLGRSTIVYFGTQVGSTLAGAVATWYINVTLGASAFGEYSTAVAFLFWLTIPSTALGEAVKKRVSEGESQGSFLVAGHAVNLALNALLVVLLVTFREQVNVFIGLDVAVAFAGLVGAQALFELTKSSLQGYNQVKLTGVIKTFERVLRAGIHVGVLFFFGAGVAALVLGHGVALLLGTAVGLSLLDGRPDRPSRRHVAQLGSYAQFAWLGTLKTRAFAWTDVMVMRGLSLSMIGLAAVSQAQIGIYKVAWTFASVLALASLAIKTTLFPEISNLSTDENYDRIRHLLFEGVAFAGIFAIPGLFGAVVVGDKLLTLFGPEHAAGGTILVLLIGSRLFAAYGSQFVEAINAIDRPDVAFRVNLLYVAMNVGLNLVLVTLFGWYGAAFATAISSLVNIVVAGYALTTIIGRPEIPVKQLGYQITASLVMFVVVAALRGPLPDTLGWTLANVAVGALVYAVALFGLSSRVRGKVTGLVQA